MTHIDRYLVGRFGWTWVRTLIAVVLLFVFIDLLTHRREEILEHDAPPDVVAMYYLCITPELLRDFQVAAIAMLVSTFLVIGRAAQANEITAMLASGIGLHRFIRWPALLALGIAVGVFVVGETVGIAAAARADEIEKRYFGESLRRDRPGKSWANLDGGWKLHVRKFNQAALTGEDALFINLGDDQVQQIEVDRIFWDPDKDQWLLEDGNWSVFYPEENMSVETRPVTQEAAPLAESPDMLISVLDDPASETLPSLRQQIDTARERNIPVHRAEVNYHARFAAPTLTFVMMWIGLPFALKLRRGGLAVSLAASVGIGLAYLVVYAGAIGLGEIGRLEPVTAAWLANVLFAAAGAGLTLRATT